MGYFLKQSGIVKIILQIMYINIGIILKYTLKNSEIEDILLYLKIKLCIVSVLMYESVMVYNIKGAIWDMNYTSR